MFLLLLSGWYFSRVTCNKSDLPAGVSATQRLSSHQTTDLRLEEGFKRLFKIYFLFPFFLTSQKSLTCRPILITVHILVISSVERNVTCPVSGQWVINRREGRGCSPHRAGTPIVFHVQRRRLHIGFTTGELSHAQCPYRPWKVADKFEWTSEIVLILRYLCWLQCEGNGRDKVSHLIFTTIKTCRTELKTCYFLIERPALFVFEWCGLQLPLHEGSCIVLRDPKSISWIQSQTYSSLLPNLNCQAK